MLTFDKLWLNNNVINWGDLQFLVPAECQWMISNLNDTFTWRENFLSSLSRLSALKLKKYLCYDVSSFFTCITVNSAIEIVADLLKRELKKRLISPPIKWLNFLIFTSTVHTLLPEVNSTNKAKIVPWASQPAQRSLTFYGTLWESSPTKFTHHT